MEAKRIVHTIATADLDRRITFYRYTEGKDASYGTITKTSPTLLYTCWARKEHERGSEQAESNRLNNVLRVIWKTRYSNTVSFTTEDYIQDSSGVKYDIEDIQSIGTKLFTYFYTSRRS